MLHPSVNCLPSSPVTLGEGKTIGSGAVELAAAFLLLPDHKVGFTVFFVADDRMAAQHPSVNCLSPPFVGGLVRLKSVRLW